MCKIYFTLLMKFQFYSIKKGELTYGSKSDPPDRAFPMPRYLGMHIFKPCSLHTYYKWKCNAMEYDVYAKSDE